MPHCYGSEMLAEFEELAVRIVALVESDRIEQAKLEATPIAQVRADSQLQRFLAAAMAAPRGRRRKKRTA